MVKVQNGWQSHSLSELEDLASQQDSSKSTIPDRHYLPTSTTIDIPPPSRQDFMQTSPRHHLITRYDEQPSLVNKFPSPTHASYDRGEVGHAPQSDQVSGSYESFWRDHATSSALRTSQQQNQTIYAPSLAPAPDILPRTARHQNPSDTQPAPLQTANMYPREGQAGPTYPSTPSPKRISQIRTPSQQAAVEKDAVESLIFMSSPGNSTYRAPAPILGTPLRSRFASISHGRPTHLSPPRQMKGQAASRPSTKPRKPLSDAELDRMLDHTPDTSSSDDEVSQQHVPHRNALTR